ncbi:exodeoxyribonuclease V subunit gamma [Enemella sp. A6]|uniref:exodeoxyribonuclease V subunit gamma n=1 Tax=Enemella sp. A6 TaxID=3440152 RepID=UPI003EB984B1
MTTETPLTGLHAHLAPRADVLATALADELAEPPADPFAREIVSVPTAGVERWLSQALSTHLGAGENADGVSAGIDFPPLRRLVRHITAAALGVDVDTDPWQRNRLVWPVLTTMDEVLDEPWFAVVAEHLSGAAGRRPGRRFRIARRVATVFTGYLDQRPELLQDWSSGRDRVPNDLQWQPRLWRELCNRIGDPSGRLDEAVRQLQGDPRLIDLPPRLSVFGPTRLSTTEARILAAVGAHRAVHLWLPQACPAQWHQAPDGPLGPRTPPPTGGHPLVNRLGRDALELARVMKQVRHTVHDHATPSAHGPTTLLAAVQADVISGQPPRADHDLAEDDRSVQFHASHGPERQVEVLREVVLELLADDPTLEPRDIVVMCPDIEVYAPHISAAFSGTTLDGVAAHHPVHRIPVRLADRSLRQVNPVLGVLEQLLELVHQRPRASSLLALCAAEPVARRFAFTVEELEEITAMVNEAEIRWGIDNADMARHGMGDFQLNTWLAGLDRMLTGVALPAERALAGVTPLDIDSSSMVDLVGRLAELITRLRRISLDFAGLKPDRAERKTLVDWAASLRRALELVTRAAPGEDWQIHHAYSTLADLAEGAGDLQPLLTAADVSELLADAFRGRPTRASFRTGALTMCTLSPMRSVPHRVVVLLGVDDGRFPRSSTTVGDDLLARDPHEGERDGPGEDRQLLLDAVMSATETLVVIHADRDPVSNRSIPMSIPLADLFDTITETVSEPTRHRWPAAHRKHPLQPFSPSYFDATEPASFDPQGLAGARALTGPRSTAVPSLDLTVTLPAPETDTVDLADLVSFFADPLRHFLKSCGLSTWEDADEEYPEELPAALDGLQYWKLNDRVLTALVEGTEPDIIALRESRAGKVPAFQVGRKLLSDSLRDMQDIVHTAERFGTLRQVPQSVRISLPDAMATGAVVNDAVVTGAVPVAGSTHLQITASKRKAKHEVELWLNHLALCAAGPPERESVLVAHPGSFRFRVVRFGSLPAEQAREYLADLVEVYHAGVQRLVRMPVGLARDWQDRSRRRRFDWEDRWRFVDKTWHEHFTDYRELLGNDPEESEFVALAERVWGPLLAHEERP